MRIRLEMSMRDILPEILNKLAPQYGRKSFLGESHPIWLFKEVELDEVPRKGEDFPITGDYDPRVVKKVTLGTDGLQVVLLSDFDADEVGDEATALDVLLEEGWELDLSELE